MQLTSHLIAVLIASTLAAASPIKSRSSGGARTNYITFEKDWSVYPNTTVTAFYQINGQVTSTVLLDTHPTPIYKKDDYVIPPLSGLGDLAMWFTCATNGSAPKYDSKYGANYHFNIDGAMLYFKEDFNTITTGSVRIGDPVLVQYNITRVAKICPTDDTHFTAKNNTVLNKSNHEKQDLTITGNYQINDGQVSTFPIYQQSYNFHSGPQKQYTEGVIEGAVITPGKLAIWFSCQSAIASGWDSNFGKNWVFPISAHA
ncbi:hypothetical protein HDU76_011024 [Blyttiomyces sp. JEL0837]|nr:hypothetical protein HDU76_011024 [Blyttiomyces sp. JEL0837]